MELLKGIDVANAINEKLIKESTDMGGRVPKLAIIRVGERPDDMSYERGATKKMENFGLRVQSYVYPADISDAEFKVLPVNPSFSRKPSKMKPFRKNLTQLMITLRLTVFYCFVRFQNT